MTTERLRYKGPFGEQTLDHRVTGGEPIVIRRGETIDCPHVEYARALKEQRPDQWDSGEDMEKHEESD
jgi:hypothetical protein